LAELEVLDLTVTDPPIEEVIGRVFADGIPSGSPQSVRTSGAEHL